MFKLSKVKNAGVCHAFSCKTKSVNIVQFRDNRPVNTELCVHHYSEWRAVNSPTSRALMCARPKRILIVTGGRDRGDKKTAMKIVKRLEGCDLLIVGDCPTGVDALALAAACRMSIQYVVHTADWVAFGKTAGPIRNREIARHAEDRKNRGHDVKAHAFPGDGKGTKSCIRELKKLGIDVSVHKND